MDTTKQVLSKEDMQRMLGLKGGFGKAVAGLVIKVLEIDKVNRTQAKYNQLMGPDFAHAILEDQGVTYDIPEGQLDRIPAEGGFITVSNHHFGSIDGLILSDTVGRKRKDYKILTTFMLSLIPNLTESFLPVNNLGGKNDARSINSIRMALEHNLAKVRKEHGRGPGQGHRRQALGSQYYPTYQEIRSSGRSHLL